MSSILKKEAVPYLFHTHTHTYIYIYMIGPSMLFTYSTNICIHCLVPGQPDWAHVTRVAKSFARRAVSSAAREEGVLI